MLCERELDAAAVAVPGGPEQLLVRFREAVTRQPDGVRGQQRHGEHEQRHIEDLAGAAEAEQREQEGLHLRPALPPLASATTMSGA